MRHVGIMRGMTDACLRHLAVRQPACPFKTAGPLLFYFLHLETAAHVTRTPPRRAFNAGRGEAQQTENYRSKNRPSCLRTVLGLAQQCVALMCGPGPGAPVGVQKKGRTFVPLYLCTGSRSRAHGRTKQNRGGKPR